MNETECKRIIYLPFPVEGYSTEHHTIDKWIRNGMVTDRFSLPETFKTVGTKESE